MPRSRMLSARMGGFLGRVSRVFALTLQGDYAVLDRTGRIVGIQGQIGVSYS